MKKMIISPTSVVGTTGNTYAKEWNETPYLTPFTKIDSEYAKD